MKTRSSSEGATMTTTQGRDQRLAIEGGTPAVSQPINAIRVQLPLARPKNRPLWRCWKASPLFRYYGHKPLFKVAAFEQAFASYVGSQHALATNGTAALRAGLVDRVGPGDEVIVPSVTFIASVGAIVASRARPIFAEVDDLMQLDPNDLAKKITKRTKAIMPVHLTGVAADMDPIIGLCP